MWPFSRRGYEVYVPPAPSPRAPEALAALRAAPGPSPWYLERVGRELARTTDTLHWRTAGDGPRRAGKSLLTTTRGDVLAAADFCCYVRVLGVGRLLVWYADDSDAGPLHQRSIRLRLFNTEQFQPVDDVEALLSGLGTGTRFHAPAGEIASVAVSTARSDGTHTIDLPGEFRDVGELLILAHSTAEARSENHYDRMHLRLWVLDAATGRLEIVPQDWFNGGAYDFGYQWVTRVARLPGSGDVVGEGIRLGVFRLDSSKRQIAEWLVENTFYHPER